MRSLLPGILLFSAFAAAQMSGRQVASPTHKGTPSAARPHVAPPNGPLPQFEDISKQAGLTVSHISLREKSYIVESMSGGVGFIDCDNDGKLDLITVNGSTIERFKQGGDPLITLYHQEANLKFKDITASTGLTHKGWGMGVAVADYDNDGLPDIYVTGFGGNALYHNLGNCKFEDVTDKAGRRRRRLQHWRCLGRLRWRRQS